MANSPFTGVDGTPQLVDCAVVYFDLLGVSAKAKGAAAQSELVDFDKIIREALPYPIGEAAARAGAGAYPATVFSDSVIAAVPIEAGLPPAQAVFQLAFDIARLQTDLAVGKYFARGAITLDKLHFHDGLVFGPALVEAADLERAVAVNPRIILSPAATEALRAARGGEVFFGEPPVLVDEDGLAFIDYLGGALQIDPEFDLPEKLHRHKAVVSKELDEQATNFPRWSKHRWVAEYHNATCLTYRDLLAEHGGIDDFLITAVHTTPEFVPLPAAIWRGGSAHQRGPSSL